MGAFHLPVLGLSSGLSCGKTRRNRFYPRDWWRGAFFGTRRYQRLAANLGGL